MHNIVLKRLNETQSPDKLKEMKIIQTKVYDKDIQHGFFISHKKNILFQI